MSRYDEAKERLRRRTHTWLVTGAAGFIGSNLVETLLALGQRVVGLDNFATGHRRNLEEVTRAAGRGAAHFHFIEGDIRDLPTCHAAAMGVDYVLHHAALGSVPRSLHDPIATHQANVDGFLNVLVAARDAGVRRVVFASSSSAYGDHPALPKVEDRVGRPLSPYALTKYVDELYAAVFERAYGVESIGLRYFNVYGRRQDPQGEYAAVIPRWIDGLLRGTPCVIYGDGETSRDFCYIDNAVQANLLAATAEDAGVTDQVYNVACGYRTTLNELFALLRAGLAAYRSDIAAAVPIYASFRAGDVRHSLADIGRIRRQLGYEPTHSVGTGLREALDWYVRSVHAKGRVAEAAPAHARAAESAVGTL